MKTYVDAAKLQEYTTKLVAKLRTIFTGTPQPAATVADMTDHDKLYVYTGSETGYSAGNLYYWDGTAWTSGGVYNSAVIETDTTLSVSGKAADGKATGDAIAAAKAAVLAEIAPAYSTSGTYAVGDYVIYNSGLYRCVSAISTAESWTAAHWVSVDLAPDLGGQVAALKTQLNDTEDAFIGRGKTDNEILLANLFPYGTPYSIFLDTTNSVQATYTWGVTFKDNFSAVKFVPDMSTAEEGYSCKWKRYTNGTGAVLVTTDTLSIIDEGTVVKGGEIILLNVKKGETLLLETANLKTKQFTAGAVITGKTNIVGIKKSDNSISIPDRYQIGGTYTFYTSENSVKEEVDKLAETTPENQWNGKKCVCIGDSIMWYDGHTFPNTETVAVGYPSYLHNVLGMTVTNLAVSGACVADNTDHPETDNVTTVDSVDFTEYDLVILEGGINDYLRGTPLGQYASSSFDKTTLWGAYQYILETILTENPTIQIIMFLPYRVAWGGASGGPSLADVIETIESIAERYGIPLIDLYRNSGFNRRTYGAISTAGTYTIDGLHSNNDGYKRLNDILISRLKDIGCISQ